MKGFFQHFRSSDYVRILVMRTIGNFLVLASLFMIGKTFYQPVREEVRYFIDQSAGRHYFIAGSKEAKQAETVPTQKGALAKLLALNNVEIVTPKDTDFSIVIPKIGANSNIIANVNAANESEYLQALKHGVAHAAGTAFPGEGGHIFLFAHSTDYIWNVGTYNAVFYLLYKLEKGDEVNLFYKGQRYVYRVIDKRIVDPTDVEYLTRKTNKEFLTLQTCWPPGTTLKRQLIFATRVAE